MPWWPKRGGQADSDGQQARRGGGWRFGGGGERSRAGDRSGVGERTEVGIRVEVPSQRPAQPSETIVGTVDMTRLGTALDRLEIRYLTDGDGSLLAMWERHAVLFTLEGPDDEILVIRARPHGTVPPDWADRAYRVVNEWNHSRRFCKAYIGDATERGQLPIYAEMQVPLISGAHDALLVELIDCAAAVAVAFVDWLHDEGGLL